MRRIGRWAAAVTTVLASVLVSAISAGTAFAAGAPPAGGFSGGAGQGGKGIDHSLLIHRDSVDWTLAIVMLVAGLLAVAVILVLSRQRRNVRSAGAVTPTVTS